MPTSESTKEILEAIESYREAIGPLPCDTWTEEGHGFPSQEAVDDALDRALTAEPGEGGGIDQGQHIDFFSTTSMVDHKVCMLTVTLRHTDSGEWIASEAPIFFGSGKLGCIQACADISLMIRHLTLKMLGVRITGRYDESKRVTQKKKASPAGTRAVPDFPSDADPSVPVIDVSKE